MVVAVRHSRYDGIELARLKRSVHGPVMIDGHNVFDKGEGPAGGLCLQWPRELLSDALP
jgi:hypothetical protein